MAPKPSSAATAGAVAGEEGYPRSPAGRGLAAAGRVLQQQRPPGGLPHPHLKGHYIDSHSSEFVTRKYKGYFLEWKIPISVNLLLIYCFSS